MSSGEQRSRPGLVLGLLLLAGVSLSGCGRNSDSETDNYGQLAPPMNSRVEDGQFGNRFEQASRADPNSEPINVADGDLPPVDPTREPVDVP